MVAAGSDPVDSLLNSIQAVKTAFSPLESSIRKAAKDFEHCWPNIKSRNVCENKKGNDLDFVNQETMTELNVRRKSNSGGRGQYVIGDEKKKGMSIKLPIKMFVGMFSEKSGVNTNNASIFGENGGRKGLKERYGAGVTGNGGKEEGACVNCLQFAVAWSFIVNGFVQSIPMPFKYGKKRTQKVSDENCGFENSCAKMHGSSEGNEKGFRGRVAVDSSNEGLYKNEEKNHPLECFIGFVFDQFIQTLQKFDARVPESESNVVDSVCDTVPTNQFDHIKALARVFEGKKPDVNGILGNLKFARVGGVPASIVEVPSSDKEVSDVGDNSTRNQEDNGGSSAQKLANGLLSIPLSNVERLKSTLSTVSLTEMIELIPHLGRPSKDHPDKKKLFSVQDFFRYTEAEGMPVF